MSVTLADVRAAASRIQGSAIRTPVLTSRTFDERFGCQAFFKCECFQRAGAFKFRGAYNALAQLPPEVKGVLTYSSGNHAQALALAGRELGIAVTVVMPHDAPAVKRAATEAYGGEVIPYVRGEQERERVGSQIAAERGLVVVPPFDHPHVIAGAGTAGLELAEEVEGLDIVLVCCGGAGLLAGCAVAVKGLQPAAQVMGVEPEAGDDGGQSWRSGKIVSIEVPDTIADGARTQNVGVHNFEIMRSMVDGMLAVSDRSLLETTLFLWTRMKVMAEPTGALAAAAIWEGKVDVRGKRVGVLISGGNCDPGSVIDAARALNLAS